MRSMRLPLGRLLKVGGKSETRLNQIVPGLSVEMTKRLSFESATWPVVRVTSYFFHWVSSLGTVADAATAPLLDSMVDGEWAMEIVAGLGVERGVVGGVGVNGDAPVAFVGDADAAAGRNLGDFQRSDCGEGGAVDRVGGIESDFAVGAVAVHERTNGRVVDHYP